MKKTNRLIQGLGLSIFMLVLSTGTSCQSKNDSMVITPDEKEELAPMWKAQEEEVEDKLSYTEIHPYGGWYCPDNLGMFPPVDLKDYKNVPVILNRLPSYEETRNGKSLMYFDTKEIPNAKVIDLSLPRLAKYYQHNTRKEEWVIIIQAVAVESDTVVGFRYLNGGNGSSWLNEVKLMEEEKVNSLEEERFIYEKLSINASTHKIWEQMTNKESIRELGLVFDPQQFVDCNWKGGAKLSYVDKNGKVLREGNLTAAWEGLYLQVDYDLDRRNYTEKVFMMQNENTGISEVKLVVGPFTNEIEKEEMAWKNWLKKLKVLSEAG